MGESRVAVARSRFSRRRLRGLLGRLKVPLLVVAVLGVVAGGAWLLLWSDALAVDRVEVQGTRLLDSATVEDAVGVRLGTPLARVDLDEVADRVEQLPAVADVEVSRGWPGTLQVVVRERQSVAVVEEDGHYRGLDGEGVLFRDYTAPPDSLPLVRSDDLDQAATAAGRADALREVALVVEALPVTIARRVDHVELASLDSIALLLRDGTRVRWGSADESGLKADVLLALMEIPAETYDVSVPGLPTTSG